MKTRSMAIGLRHDYKSTGKSMRSPSPQVEQQSSYRKSPTAKGSISYKCSSKYSPSKFANLQKERLHSKLKSHYRKYISEKHSR